MAVPKIGLQAVLEDEQFRKGLKNYIDGIDKMEKGNKEMSEAAKKSGKSLDGLSDDMRKTGISALDLHAQMQNVKDGMEIIKELAGKGLELAKLGATAERVEERFAAFAENAGGATEILEAFQEGAGGAASEMDAMLASSKLLQMGLVTNADEMTSTVELATRLGDQTASVTNRVEDFALMLANQSIPRLDNFGISSGKVRARITELMGSVEGMTREQAFMQATMEAGAESLAILGERTEDTAMTFEIMEARMADARVELGKKLAPAFGAAFKALGSLGDEAFMVASAFGEFGGALVKAGPLLNAMLPALQKMPAALKAMNLGLNRSTLAMGALLVAIPVLVKVTGDLIEKNKEVDTVAKQVVATAAQWELGIAVQISKGREAAEVFGEYGQRAQEASDAWNANIVTGTALGGIFGAHDKILKVINKTQQEVIASAVTWGGTYAETIKYIDIYNAKQTDAAFLITGFTEEIYNNILAFREWVGPAEAVNVAVWDLSEAMIDGELAMYGFEGTSYGLTQQTQELHDAMEAGQNSIYGYETATQRAKRQTQEASAEIERRAQVVKDAAAAEEEATKKAEDQLRKLAAAHEAAKEAAFRHAEGLLSLAEKLSSAEDSEALLRASLDKLRQMQEDGLLPADQYLTMYANLQEQFGFTTEKGVFLKDGIELLGEALVTGKIKPMDYGDAVEHLNEMAEAGETDVRLFKEEIEKYESPAEAATKRTEEFMQAIEDGEMPMDKGFAAIDRLKTVYTETEEPAISAAEGVDEFTESVLEAQDPIDELLDRAERLPQDMLAIGPGMREAGKSLVGAFRVGFEGAWDALEAEKVERLAIFREEFHASREPKDPTSPLRGFFEAGQALVQTYMEGLESMFPELGNTLDKLFAFGGAAGGLGGAAAAILNKSARALKDATKGVDAELLALYKSIGGKGAPRGAEALQQAIVAALGGAKYIMELQFREARGDPMSAENRRRLLIYQELNRMLHERNELQTEYTRHQEKLLRLEEAQMRLRFLEQQVSLLKLIDKHKLDPADILQGLALGADAAAEDVLDAMVRVMEEVIRQTEERLGIESPSKVFRKIGQQTMQGMALGIRELATLPVRESMMASRSVASSPALYAGRDYNVSNTRRVTVNSGGNTFNTGMDETAFSARTTRDVSRAMRGQ